MTSQTRLRPRICTQANTVAAMRASRSLAQAMQRCARYPVPSLFIWNSHCSPMMTRNGISAPSRVGVNESIRPAVSAP